MCFLHNLILDLLAIAFNLHKCLHFLLNSTMLALFLYSFQHRQPINQFNTTFFKDTLQNFTRTQSNFILSELFSKCFIANSNTFNFIHYVWYLSYYCIACFNLTLGAHCNFELLHTFYVSTLQLMCVRNDKQLLKNLQFLTADSSGYRVDEVSLHFHCKARYIDNLECIRFGLCILV